MKQLVFHHNSQLLPPATNNTLPVLLYGLPNQGRSSLSYIGNPVVDKIKRLGVQIPTQAIDFLSIALAVTAADTFVPRADTADGWTREFSIQLPLCQSTLWQSLKKDLEDALHFLSGDIWNLVFKDGGYPPPKPYAKKSRYHLTDLEGLDCVCLFSGGLDSAIGVIDLIKQGRAPLLVSHSYKGDKKHQDQVNAMLNGQYSRFEVNADPHASNKKTDITMRTRSLNFLAFACVGVSAVGKVSQKEPVDLIVPENGFISLNTPLTPRRIGTLSTRTTHPHFMQSIQGILDAVNIPGLIKNPYQFKTKGQMIAGSQNKQLLRKIASKTVSCSHWKRKSQQCGVCVPCIIRRAALHAGGIQENVDYAKDLADVLDNTNLRDDYLALSIAIARKKTQNLGSWILENGPLPSSQYQNFQKVFLHGLDEVECYFRSEGLL